MSIIGGVHIHLTPVPRGRCLPDLTGQLSVTVPSPTIERANEEVARESLAGLQSHA